MAMPFYVCRAAHDENAGPLSAEASIAAAEAVLVHPQWGSENLEVSVHADGTWDVRATGDPACGTHECITRPGVSSARVAAMLQEGADSQLVLAQHPFGCGLVRRREFQ
jgi:hypothetical protein